MLLIIIKNLFGPAPGYLFAISRDLSTNNEKLTGENNEKLTKPFSIEEIKNALFSMDTNRAPAPDNIPIEFYQHCWDVVKNDIVKIFDQFYEGSLDVQRLNYGVITLLPKISEANKIEQYRPICLLRCIYKWITKTLYLRADPFASNLFSMNQKAFIKKKIYSRWYTFFT